MFARLFAGEFAKRSVRWLIQLWQGRATPRVRWSSWIVVVLLAVAVLTLLARRGPGSAAREESSSPVTAAPADATPAAPARPDATKSRPKGGAGTAATTPDATSLQTIGTLAAAHYFQTYLNLGFLAEARAKGTYSNEDARKVLRSVLSVVDSVDRQLESFGKRVLGPEDRASLVQMQEIATLLRQQSTELQTYWDSGEDAARFENLRKSSYAAISKLLAISP